MIRRDLTDRLGTAARAFPAVTLAGPRQSGKSTLCRVVGPKHAHANLEAPDTRAFATEDPRAFLDQFPEGAILDEIQRCPDLPSYLQERIDADPAPGRWILNGSQSMNLLSSISQSLAGRTAILHLLPLTRAESRRFPNYPQTLDEALLTGGYPRILDQNLSPAEWLGAYIGTYIEREVRQVSNIGDLAAFQRFLQLCAGRTARLLNLASLATDCGITQPTAKAWLSVLEATFITFRLPPYLANIRKRIVKTPKLHFYDTGVVCWLLGIRSSDQLRTHPLRGAVFETWVASEIIKVRTNRAERAGVYFYRDQHGLEADLLLDDGGKLTIVEAKAAQTITTDTFRASRAVAATLAPAIPTEVVAIYGGDQAQQRSEATILPWDGLEGRQW